MIPTDPLYGQQWHFTKLGNIEKIWDEYTGAGIHVGVYDTGVQSSHPDLAANYDATRHIVFDGEVQDGNPDLGVQDPVEAAHGTLAAGLIAAAANNDEGGVGVAWGATLTGVNIDSYVFSGSDISKLASAFLQMTNFDVVNHSWGHPPDYNPAYNLNPTTAISLLHAACGVVSRDGRGGLGTVIVQGAGNTDMDAQGYGLNVSRYTITVAAAGPDGLAADYSISGACVLVSAPSRATASSLPALLSTDITGANGFSPGDYGDFGGTSGATPIVTGVVALMLDANPGLGWRDVQNILAASATHTGSAIGSASGTNEESTWFINDARDWNGGGRHFSNDYGYGLVNAYNAVRMAEAWSLFETAQVWGNEIHWGPWQNLTPQAIADQATIESSVVVGDANPANNMTLEHVTVTVDLRHADFTQLRIFLVSPDGTEVQLADGSGGDDTRADAGMTWTFGIDALRGEDAFGEWTIRIEDAVAGGGSGTLNSVKFDFYGQFVSPDDVYHYTDEFLDMAAVAGGGSRTTLADTDGGTDWINAAAVAGNIALNLNAGMTSKVSGVNWFAIAAGTAIENAVTGDGNDTLTGNGSANKLHGMRGNDTLSGALGDDLLDGGANNDTARYQTGGGVTVNLSMAGAQNTGSAGLDTLVGIENLIGSATGADILTGNGLANVLSGLGGNDTLAGFDGVDTLLGSTGNDVLRGGAGNDVLTGGVGRDLLFGDADRDMFNFDSKSETKKGGSRDQILSFQRGQDDIDLKDIDAKKGSGNQKFKFIGKKDFSDEKGELRYEDKGAKVIVQGDIDGNGKADFEIYVAAGSLGKGDFLL